MIEMGVFGAHGIQPVHQDLPSKYIRGVPFDVLEEREVSVVCEKRREEKRREEKRREEKRRNNRKLTLFFCFF